MKWNVCRQSCSPQSRHNFGERVLSNFITNIMAAIIDFDGSGRLGREINLYQGGRSTVKIKERGGGGGVKITREFITLARTNKTPALQASKVELSRTVNL